ncbi:MAG: Uracil-DNA glycosylase [Parcubacteria group bacterium GW2011_GWF2_38_76]|nr:MAG: Uracil-DNA glycosylase [Parcubacteria group bacterium GW2011_GWF2_38_76]
MNKKEKKQLMDEMSAELSALKKSPLYKYRTENNYLPVVGEGDLSAKIMFIGEAPGRNEAKTGRPFCGSAGKILDELLLATGHKREDVFVTNIVKDRPPENRDPSPEEIKIYGPFLDRQIDLIRPKVIATLGRYSMKYILEKFGLHSELKPISEMHGKYLEAKAPYGKIKIAVLYHPCVAIYNRSKMPDLKKDFKILTKLS